MTIAVRGVLSSPARAARAGGWVCLGTTLALLGAVPLDARAGGYPAAEASTAVPCVHVAEAGDTLQSLSKRYFGDEARWRELLALNPQVGDTGELAVGQAIVLKPCPAET